MTEESNIMPTDVIKASEISRKVWKFIIEIATSEGNCEHIAKAKELLKELSQTL